MNLLRIGQTTAALLLIGLVLIQSQEGLSAGLWGGESYRTKRGIEKTLVFATAFFSALFIIFSIAATVV